VYRLCRSLTYSKEDAEDLFQETFLRAVERHSKVCASDDPKAFLCSACVYIWKSRKRKYARRNRLAPSGAPRETASASDEDGPADDAAAGDLPAEGGEAPSLNFR
jgi:RNA polymerase sigma-70 factor (ECF subfamily)